MQLEQTQRQQRNTRKDVAKVQRRERANDDKHHQTIDDFMVSLTAAPVQLDALDAALTQTHGAIKGAASRGIAGPSQALPHREKIQAAFGPEHDVSGIQAHTGASAAAACDDMNANGYASGDHVVFGEAPSVALAAHEATHVVQQQAGKVQLSGGVGKSGDAYEQQADAVAARVAAGQSAADLLPAPSGAASSGVQLDAKEEAPSELADDQKAKIDKMTLQEVDNLISKIEGKLETDPKNTTLQTALTYAKAHKKDANSDVHGAATTGTDEDKKNRGAVGRAVGVGGSVEVGKTDSKRAEGQLAADGQSTSATKQSRESKSETTTHTSTTDAAGTTTKASDTTPNITDATKTTDKVEHDEATRKNGVTVREKTVDESTSNGSKKSTSTTTIGDEKQTVVIEGKKENATLDDQRRAKEKKDLEDREKLLLQGDKKLDAKVKELQAETDKKLSAAKTDAEKKAIREQHESDRKKLLQPAQTSKGVTLLNLEKTKTAGDDRKKKGKLGAIGLEGEAATAEAKVGGQVGWDPTKGLVVTGSAGAKATLVGGSAKIETPAIAFTIGSESFQASFGVTLSASIVAEAQGSIALNRASNAAKVGIELAQGETKGGTGVAAKASVFAGAKAGIEVGAKVDWLKKASYRDEVTELLKKYLPGFVAKRLPVDKIALGLIGSGGKVSVIGIKGSLDGTAGAGVEAGGGISVAGGVVKVDGKFQGTVGLGLSTSIKAEIDAIEGMRMLGIVIAKTPAFLTEVGMSPDDVWAWVKKQASAVYKSIRGD